MQSFSFSFLLEDSLKDYRKLFQKYGNEAKYLKDEIISRSGVKSEYVYFILDGTVKISVSNPNGYERVLGFHKKNTLFVMDGLRPDENVIVTTTAVTDLHVIRLSPDKLEAMIAEDSHFGMDLLRYYGDVLRLMCNDAESSSTRNVESMMANFIVLYIIRHDPKNMILPFSQSELAALIGSSRIQVARILARWKQEHYIDIGRKNIQILDLDGVKQFVSTSILTN